MWVISFQGLVLWHGRLRCNSGVGVRRLNFAVAVNHPPSGWALSHGQTEFWQVWFSSEEQGPALQKHSRRRKQFNSWHILLCFFSPPPTCPPPLTISSKGSLIPQMLPLHSSQSVRSAGGGRGQKVLLCSQAGLGLNCWQWAWHAGKGTRLHEVVVHPANPGVSDRPLQWGPTSTHTFMLTEWLD